MAKAKKPVKKKTTVKKDIDDSYQFALDALKGVGDDIRMGDEELADPSMKTSPACNFMELKTKCESKTNDFIDYLVEFYLSKDVLKLPHTQSKIDDDKNTLSKLLFQIETSEHAIMRCLERIEVSPEARLFEVLSQCQRAQMDIIKHYEADKKLIEDNYKMIKETYAIQRLELPEHIGEIKPVKKKRDMKSILRDVHKSVGTLDVKDHKTGGGEDITTDVEITNTKKPTKKPKRKSQKKDPPPSWPKGVRPK